MVLSVTVTYSEIGLKMLTLAAALRTDGSRGRTEAGDLLGDHHSDPAKSTP